MLHGHREPSVLTKRKSSAHDLSASIPANAWSAIRYVSQSRLSGVNDPIDMTSPDWHRLTDEERYDRIEPICEQFVQRFAEFPNIDHIGHTPFDIYVGLALPRGAHINELPYECLGVPVE